MIKRRVFLMLAKGILGTGRLFIFVNCITLKGRPYMEEVPGDELV